MEPHDGHRPADADPGARDADAQTAEAPDRAVAEAAARPVASAGAADGPPLAGNETVAAALQELATVGRRPLAEHPDAFARVHGGLQQALSDIDDA